VHVTTVASGTGRVGTAAFVIAYVAACDGPTLTVDQLRQWKRRSHIRRVGTDPSGFAVYDLDDVLRHAARRGMFAQPAA
jgi:hypothetical protein